MGNQQHSAIHVLSALLMHTTSHGEIAVRNGLQGLQGQPIEHAQWRNT